MVKIRQDQENKQLTTSPTYLVKTSKQGSPASPYHAYGVQNLLTWLSFIGTGKTAILLLLLLGHLFPPISRTGRLYPFNWNSKKKKKVTFLYFFFYFFLFFNWNSLYHIVINFDRVCMALYIL